MIIIKLNKHKHYEKCEVRLNIVASETLEFITELDGRTDTIINILLLSALIWMVCGTF